MLQLLLLLALVTANKSASDTEVLLASFVPAFPTLHGTALLFVSTGGECNVCLFYLTLCSPTHKAKSPKDIESG